MSKGKVVLGFLGGAAAGAILGVLFAPDSGEKTRKKISDKSGEVSDEVRDKFNEFVDNVSKKVDEANEKVKKSTEKAKEKSS